MTNFNFQGKIIRHFWGKLIRQSTIFLKFCVYNVLSGGGAVFILKHKKLLLCP